jgi:beta-glucosidase
LKAEYFDNLDFSGAPKMTRVDRIVNFDFFHTAPAGFKPTGFSVRWTGVIMPPTAGLYQLGFRMMRRKGEPLPNVKVWIDGALVVTPELAGITPETTAQCIAGNCSLAVKPIYHIFNDTHAHAVRIDYVRATEDRASAFDWVPPQDALIDGAVSAARSSDAVIAFVGLSPDLEGEEMPIDFPGFKEGDRTALTLPDSQRRMLEAVKKTGKPLVVVYLTGGAICDPWVKDNADAIVQAWYPGQAAGTAIASVLTGQYNPAGRLPYTIYDKLDDLPAYDDYSMEHRTYRYFRGPVMFEFGYGLSYTTFKYSAVSLAKSQVQAGNDVGAVVSVANVGPRDGDEVVELYVARPGVRTRPILAGFTRVHLKAGEQRVLRLLLPARAQSQVAQNGDHVITPGRYTVYVGGSQPQGSEVKQAQFVVRGERVLAK